MPFQSLSWKTPLFILSELVKGGTVRGGQFLPWEKRPMFIEAHVWTELVPMSDRWNTGRIGVLQDDSLSSESWWDPLLYHGKTHRTCWALWFIVGGLSILGAKAQMAWKASVPFFGLCFVLPMPRQTGQVTAARWEASTVCLAYSDGQGWRKS